MLVLSRKLNESVIINGTIRVTVVGIRHNQIRLGFEAPDQVGIYREELCDSARPVESTEAAPALVPSVSQPEQPGR